MKLFMVILLTSFTSWSVLACDEITGTYQSVSETHWNYILELKANTAKLTYTNYLSGKGETKTNTKTVSSGKCSQLDKGFMLTFAERTINIEFHKKLSRKPFGGKGHSPGITGELLKGKQVSLWLVLNDM